MREPPYAGRVLNVSVMGGFAYADTPFNGLTVVVTATDAAAADALAREIAEAGWARRERFRPTLTSLDDASRLAKVHDDLARWSSPTSPTTPAAAGAATRCGSCRRSTGPACAMPWSA